MCLIWLFAQGEDSSLSLPTTPIYDTTFSGLSAGTSTVPPFTPTPDSSRPRYETVSKPSSRAGTPGLKPRPTTKCSYQDTLAETAIKENEALERIGTLKHERMIGELDLKRLKLENQALDKRHQREHEREQHEFRMMQMQLMISQNPQAAASVMMQSRDLTSQGPGQFKFIPELDAATLPSGSSSSLPSLPFSM